MFPKVLAVHILPAPLRWLLKTYLILAIILSPSLLWASESEGEVLIGHFVVHTAERIPLISGVSLEYKPSIVELGVRSKGTLAVIGV